MKKNKIKQNNFEGKDICYKCGKIQSYGTMKDIDPDDFAIYCTRCLKKLKNERFNTYE